VETSLPSSVCLVVSPHFFFANLGFVLATESRGSGLLHWRYLSRAIVLFVQYTPQAKCKRMKY
jgi:hypothetical protein